MFRKLSSAALVAAITAAGGAAALAVPGAAGHGDGFAFGEPGDPKKPARVVQIVMKEGDGQMLFIPDRIKVRKGEQIRFAMKNNGENEHEFVIGTVEENRAHAAQMQKNPDMEHDDPNARRLSARQNGDIVWRFSKAGTFEYACLIPGHLEAGMKGTIVVR
ncbi:cupredoxin family protein [Chelatococcus sp. SYSU_G07232]|uniref:Cupredoxin family protein n=1 Tax=Chelatococcus albus TaxID=3047466 RepID=A0ABT7AFJ2_9HYPH|nr:cupredoxin family protein [Chelatococcus sp. SYSU_G07232]MDJ1157777.1 cupredoxin family protein [Chelatococcus sp. SYSU_G07232]